MVRLFKHYVPHTVLLLGLIDFVLLMVAGEAGWVLRMWQIESNPEASVSRLPELLTFAITLQLSMVGVGIYGIEALQSMRFAVARLVVSISLGVILLSMIFFFVPALTFWRSNLLYPMLLALCVLILARILLGHTLDSQGFKRRVMVLGAGPRAARLEQLARRNGASFMIVGYVGMNTDRPPSLMPSIATISPIFRSMWSPAAPARWCSRSKSGAMRCR